MIAVRQRQKMNRRLNINPTPFHRISARLTSKEKPDSSATAALQFQRQATLSDTVSKKIFSFLALITLN
jgi:hypothetical protein